MDVSVIIVNYHTSKLINDCIASIFKHTEGVEYEVVVVDNNTENLSIEIASADDVRVKLIQLDSNLGFGCANNEGARVAKGRNIFFLNPDTLLLNNAIKILSDYLDHNPKCGGCGGNLYDINKHPVMSFHHKMPGVFWEFDDLLNTVPEKIRHGKNRWFNHTGAPLSVGYIQGADLMMPKDLFDKLGGFSDEFFMYYEETDLCRRIHESGHSLVSVPRAEIIHYESASFTTEDAFERKWKMVYKSRMIYLRRAYGKMMISLANSVGCMFLRSRCLLIKDEQKRHCYKTRLMLFKESIKR